MCRKTVFPWFGSASCVVIKYEVNANGIIGKPFFKLSMTISSFSGDRKVLLDVKALLAQIAVNEDFEEEGFDLSLEKVLFNTLTIYFRVPSILLIVYINTICILQSTFHCGFFPNVIMVLLLYKYKCVFFTIWLKKIK